MTSTSLRWILIFSLVTFVSLEPHQRSGLRIVHKLVGGHINANRDDDVELMTSGAGDGQVKTKKGPTDAKKAPQEEKKTLSQQVADGKYALIQNELFSKPVKRPGLISYSENSEVPNDNINNFGGLNKSDIWLSENHLLVIKGGFYSDHGQDNKDVVWAPIDDFKAFDRQVKIPSHPKVPPPFPVQLYEGGPILLFLGPNVTKTLNGTLQEAIHSLYPENNEVSGGEGGSSKKRPSSGKHPPYPSSGEIPFPIPPFPPPSGPDDRHQIKPKEGIGVINGSSFPSEMIDFPYYDDDPSVYYPPPYTFYYAKNNSTEVPPGPIVPGIVVPPPPDFFGSLEEENSTSTTPTPTRIQQNVTTPRVSPRKKPTTQSSKSSILKPISRTKNITQSLRQKTRVRRPLKICNPPSSSETPKVKLTSRLTTTEAPKFTRKQKIENPQRIIPQVVNHLSRITTQQPPIEYYFYDDNIISTTPKTAIDVDIKDDNYYFSKEILLPQHPQSPPNNVRYYYDGEPNYPNIQPSIRNFKEQQRKNSFSLHIARLKEEIENYQNGNDGDESNRNFNNKHNYYDNSYNTNNYYENSKPVYQYEFQAADYRLQNYQNSDLSKKRPFPNFSVEIQEAVEVTPSTSLYETTREAYYSDAITENPAHLHEFQGTGITNYRTPKPISQFSFEATQNTLYTKYYATHDDKFIDDTTKQHLSGFVPSPTTPLPNQRQKIKRPQRKRPTRPTYEGDTYINYLPQRPRLNPYSESVQRPANQKGNFLPRARQTERPIVTYRLPGDEGTHFYFLTPQLAQKREQDASFYFSNTKNKRRCFY